MTIVIGAGMAGLLAAAMLRNECKCVVEKQSEVPNNHSAVLRFRSHIVGDALNIPFKKVSVMKAVQEWRNPIADALAYSNKTNGSYTLRSIISANSSISDRYIAPADFIQQMVDRVNCEFRFSTEINLGMIEDWNSEKTPIISTMPMPIMMKILEWKPKQEFMATSGTNIKFVVEDMDAYCSLYVPEPTFPGSRISITGSEVVVECQGDHGDIVENSRSIIQDVCNYLGIAGADITSTKISRQKYSKILPYDENDRKRFIMWASDTWGIYSLGRFATWRPGVLLDDLVNDIRFISRVIKNSSSIYSHKKSYS